MDYFDNASLVEAILEATTTNTSNTKGNTGWWIAGLFIVGCIAAVYIYKYDKLKKELKKQS